MEKNALLRALKRTYPFVKPYMLENILSIVLSLLSTTAFLLIPYLIKVLIDDILIQGKWESMQWFGIMLALAVIVGNLFRFLSGYFYVIFSQKIVIDARVQLFTQLVYNDLSFFQNYQLGDLSNRFNDDTSEMHALFSFVLPNIIRNVFTVGFVLIMMFRMNLMLTLVVMGSLPIYLWINQFFGQRVRQNVHYARQKMGTFSTFIYDVFSKILIIKNFVCEEREVEKLEKLSHDVKHFIVKNELFVYIANTMTKFSSQAIGVLILIIGGNLALRGVLTAGAVMAFYTYLNNLYSPLLALTQELVRMNKAIAGTERYFELLQDGATVTEVSQPQQVEELQGEIRIDQLDFAYQEEPILSGISFEIHPKEKIAILGRSGIGKSTLALLMKRFYDPRQGQIFLDGIDIAQLGLKDLRRQVGFLPQEPMILEGTIRENLELAREDVTEEQIVDALRIVHLEEFTNQLPMGMNTVLGNNGAQLSGGQKQRLAMARLIIQDPPVVVFDEVFSHLDVETEKIIWENVKSWLTHKTVIFITHKLWEPEYFDRLVILNKKVEAVGHYTELKDHSFLQKMVV